MSQHGIGFQGDLGLGQLLQRRQQQGGGLGQLGASAGSALLMSGGNPLLAAGIFGGSQLLSGLSGLIGGPSRSQRLGRQLFGQFGSQIGQQVFDPQQFLSNIRVGLRPQNEAIAQRLSRSVGIQSPLAQAGIAQLQAPLFAQLLNQLQFGEARLRTQRDLGFGRLQLGAAGLA